MKLRTLAVATLAGALALSGCGGSDGNGVVTSGNGSSNPVPVATPTATATPTASPTPQPLPLAVADSLTGRANAQITGNVLTNDTLSGAAISAHTDPAHGTLVLNADGSFVYTPTTSFQGIDSFTYTLSNSVGAATATVTFTLSGVSVFVNNQAATGGDGSQVSPLRTLAAAVSAVRGVDGAQIVVFQGDGTTTGLDGQFGLGPNQSLIGASSSAVPTLTGPIFLGMGNLLKNLHFANSPSYAVYAYSSSNSTLDAVTISNSSSGGLILSGANGTLAFRNSSVIAGSGGGEGLVANTYAGFLNLSVENCTFTNNTVNLNCYSFGSSNVTTLINNNTFTTAPTPPQPNLLMGVVDKSVQATNITNNTVTNGDIGFELYTGGNGTLYARVVGNNISGLDHSALYGYFTANSLAKLRWDDNVTLGNGKISYPGVDVTNGDAAQVYSTFTNNTSDVYLFSQFGTGNIVVEELATFANRNVGVATATTPKVVTAPAGSSGIP